ncbi:hypothetical protein [Thalassospira povalilytica]|uniref:hypothetical protein n=1 Tax=Thalassospira povalilytica TaxID=732237 RepID=UPI003AA7B2CA
MSSQIHSSPYLSTPESTTPGAEFLFGGYSWVDKKFEIWKISYQVSENQFVADPAPSLGIRFIKKTGKTVFSRNRTGSSLGLIAFAGDQAKVAREKLLDKFQVEDEKDLPSSFNWEPFEVVRDMLRANDHSETIGGAPQVVKVYQYLKTAPIGVFWPDRLNGHPHLQGRSCLGYERTERFFLDPDSCRSEAFDPPQTQKKAEEIDQK